MKMATRILTLFNFKSSPTHVRSCISVDLWTLWISIVVELYADIDASILEEVNLTLLSYPCHRVNDVQHNSTIIQLNLKIFLNLENSMCIALIKITLYCAIFVGLRVHTHRFIIKSFWNSYGISALFHSISTLLDYLMPKLSFWKNNGGAI